jgi:cell division protein FtsI (penicillin-binding protein 3)
MNGTYRAASSKAARRKLVMSLLALATLGIVFRAVHLQLFHKDFLQSQGNDRYLRVLSVPAHRGMIVDRHGEPLAVSSPVDSVWVHPGELLKHRDHLPTLARLLRIDAVALERRLHERKEREFVYLRRHLTPDVAQRVTALGIPGINLQREYRRYYPAAEVASHLLGFNNIDDVGQEGLELAFEEQLRGVPGSKRVLRNRLGHIVEDVEGVRVPQPGEKIHLSIDRRIQYLAYRALKAAVIKHRAKAASAVMLDVSTGEILAMVNQPAANPNNRRSIKPDRFRNRAMTDVFEPGSTLKPFTIAVALESKGYRPDTMVNTAPGFLRVGRNLVRDARNYGRLDVTRVISKSSNVGTSKIALSMPRENLWRLYRDLGFGQLTGVGFPGEQSGTLNHFTSWSDFEYATHSFGYGVSMTALQLARAYAVLAADGLRRPVSLLRLDGPPAEQKRILSAETCRRVRAMLELVVSRKGTGSRASVPNYRIAGKTGTARKIIGGRYASRRYRALFAGMAPASRPRLVMVVVVDDPRGRHYYGGRVAAPVFSKVMNGALRLLNIAPDAVAPESTFDARLIAAKPPERL